MKATIWHNPRCSKSRIALARLEEAGSVGDIEVVEYLKNPPTRETLAALYAEADMAAKDGLRLGGTDAKERGLDKASDDDILDAMAADPKLIERPLVKTEKGVRMCRPSELIEEIL